MGSRVQSFFPKISFGLLGYRMDRTHSIMRIATTASPVSGADVRERMEELRLMLKVERSVQLITRTWRKWKLENNGTAGQRRKAVNEVKTDSENNFCSTDASPDLQNQVQSDSNKVLNTMSVGS